MTPKLGDRAKDKISGMEGIVTGDTHYLTGCRQLLINPAQCDDNGRRVEGVWFDVDRLEVLEEGIFSPSDVSSQEHQGGPQDSPPSRN